MRTRVGYAGGTTKNPTYTRIGDHTETIQVDYDPTRITYEQLLEAFWKNHNPCAPVYSRQYLTAIFPRDERQKELALRSLEREATRQKQKITTQVLQAGEFTLAEDYHQKYYLQQVPELAKELRAIYPSMKDFIASTAVMRVNAYLDGVGSVAVLEKEIERLGLSAQGRQRLLEIVKQRSPAAPPGGDKPGVR